MRGICTVRMAGEGYIYDDHGTGSFYREELFFSGYAGHTQKTPLERTLMEFLTQLGKAIIDFGKKAIGAFEKAIDDVKAAVDKVVDVIGALLDALIDMAKQLFSPIINKIKEMMQGICNYLKSQFESLESLITEGTGNFTLLQDILNLPYLTYFLMLPTLISSIYYIISASSMGLGTIILSVLTFVLPMAISSAMGASQKPMDIPVSTEDLIRIAWEKGLGIQDNTKLKKEENIAIISSFAGFTASKIAITILEKTKGAGTNIQKELDTVKRLVEEMSNALKWPGGYESFNEYKKAEKKYSEMCDKHKELQEKENEFQEALSGHDMARLGFIFSFFSLVMALLPVFIDNIPEELKPVLFGLSAGISIGGLITSATGLKTIDKSMAFLSGVGIASSLISVGVSIYEVSNY